MKNKIKLTLTFIVVFVAMIVTFSFSSSAAETREGKWIGAWGTAPVEVGIDGYDNIHAFVGEVTGRVVITPTASGTKMRIKLSNAYGTTPLTIYSVTVAKSLGGSKIDTKSLKVITFNNGAPSVTIPAGEEVYSDAVPYEVTAYEDLAISFYISEFQSLKTMGLSGATTYLTSGDATRLEHYNLLEGVMGDEEIVKILGMLLDTNFELALSYSLIEVVPLVATLDVYSNESAYSVVVVGDSTVSNDFPQYLGEKIFGDQNIHNVGIVGKGVIGNRLLGDGLGYGSLIFGDALVERFQRDVLGVSGVEYVIIKIGANDIIHPVCNDIVEMYPGITQPTSKELIEGYKKLIDMCHEKGVKVILADITQWKGCTRDYLGTGAKYVRTLEEFQADWKIAQEVNEWMATTDYHDGYVNLADVSANPLDIDAFLPEYTVDGIHPSDTLLQVWADYFPKGLIGVGNAPSGVKLSATSATVYKGKTKTLKATVIPETADNKEVYWHTEDPSVATVDEKGKVTAVGNGTTYIVCETKYGSGQPIYNGSNVYSGYIAKCKITVKTIPESVTLNKNSATLYTTKTLKLKATVLPADSTTKTVTWSSSDKSVATVDENGKVTAVGEGTATITCKTKSGSKTDTCVVTVKKKKEVTGLALNLDSKKLYKGKTFTLVPQITPSNATFKEVTWSSSNKSVATVDKNGKVTGVGVGTATIKCKSVDNPLLVETCKVTVVIKATGVKLSSTSIRVYETKSKTLTATVTPSDATNKNVTWKSSDTKIVKVDKNGKFTGIKPGTAYITATTMNGDYSAKCKVTVLDFVYSKKVTLNKTSVSIKDGKTYTLTATISPSNASEKSLSWSSSNTKVAKVNSKGVITAVNPGTAVITCKTKDTGKTAKCTVTVKKVTPTSVSFSASSKTIAYGKTYQLEPIILPTNATDKSVTWKSSNPDVVKVTSEGKIKGLVAGKSATITVTTVSGKKTASIKITVKPVAVTGVKLNKTATTMSLNATMTLTPTFTPSNASNKAVTWKSSDTSVVKVNSSGKVTAVGTGSAIVKCVTKDGGYEAICVIQVKSVKVLGVEINKTSATLSKGSTLTLKAEVVPSNASNKKITWSSSDTSVAKVDKNGKVTAVGAGYCQIKAKSADGNYIASCKITVR